jgi:hypothetical protein
MINNGFTIPRPENALDATEKGANSTKGNKSCHPSFKILPLAGRPYRDANMFLAQYSTRSVLLRKIPFNEYSGA